LSELSWCVLYLCDVVWNGCTLVLKSLVFITDAIL